MNGRRTMYRGILMRSRLEADYAAMLDSRGTQWKYEPMCYADSGNQYLPDFIVSRAPGESGSGMLAVDVKPASFAYDDALALSHKMETVWSSDPQVALAIVWRQWGAESNLAAMHTFGAGHPWTYWCPQQGIRECIR